MRRVALAVGLAAVLAGCGGGSKSSKGPETAYLTAVTVRSDAITFDFKTAPLDVKATYQLRSQLRECGSGQPVRVQGAVYVVVHFTPAASAELKGENVVPTYTGPGRLSGPGPVLETAKICDFEADLGWAVGIAKRLPLHVLRDGSSVTVSFGVPT
jgi:hypothetical protein